MKYLMDLLHNHILVNTVYHFEKSKKITTIYLYLYRIWFMPTIIQGIMILMNEFDFSTTP